MNNITPESVLTTEEHQVLEQLRLVYDLFLTLPVQHPMHQMEFTLAIHAAQRIVMSRPTSRAEGWIKENAKVIEV